MTRRQLSLRPSQGGKFHAPVFPVNGVDALGFPNPTSEDKRRHELLAAERVRLVGKHVTGWWAPWQVARVDLDERGVIRAYGQGYDCVAGECEPVSGNPLAIAGKPWRAEYAQIPIPPGERRPTLAERIRATHPSSDKTRRRELVELLNAGVYTFPGALLTELWLLSDGDKEMRARLDRIVMARKRDKVTGDFAPPALWPPQTFKTLVGRDAKVEVVTVKDPFADPAPIGTHKTGLAALVEAAVIERKRVSITADLHAEADRLLGKTARPKGGQPFAFRVDFVDQNNGEIRAEGLGTDGRKYNWLASDLTTDAVPWADFVQDRPEFGSDVPEFGSDRSLTADLVDVRRVGSKSFLRLILNPHDGSERRRVTLNKAEERDFCRDAPGVSVGATVCLFVDARRESSAGRAITWSRL